MRKGVVFRTIVLLFCYFLTNNPCIAQKDDLTFWIQSLKDSSSQSEATYIKIRNNFILMDSVTWFTNTNLLYQKAIKENNPRLKINVVRLMSDVTLTSFGNTYDFNKLIPDAKAGLDYALHSKDSDLVFKSFNLLSGILIGAGHEKMAMIYLIREEKLFGNKPLLSYDYPVNSIALRLSGLAYHTGNFVESIFYARKTLNFADRTYSMEVGALNTIGVCYRELRNFDSAEYYFNKGLAKARESKDSVYEFIIKGNIAFNDFYKGDYQKCIPVLNNYLTFSYRRKWLSESAKVHYVLGAIAQKNKNWNDAEKHLLLAQKDFLNEQNRSQLNITTLVNIYASLKNLYKDKKDLNNELKYTNLYFNASDSSNKYTFENDLQSLKLSEDLHRQEEQLIKLGEDQKEAIEERFLFITLIILMLLLGWLMFRIRKNKFQYQQKILQEEKERAQAELENAQIQLEKFTNSIIEQNKVVEQLTNRLNDINNDKKLEGVIHEIEKLQEIKILTDEDWQYFKNLYNKAYPGFLNRLIAKYPNLTPAESRYAALVKLNMDNKQMSHILAISTDSMRKLKFRFREKTGIQETKDEDIRKIINEI